MEQNASFHYNYSAPEHREVQEIRKKYLPREESKLEELKRLDRQVQNAGLIESLCVGIGGSLVFGLGLCMGLEVLVGGVVPAMILAAVGSGIMLTAYPVYRSLFRKAREKFVPRILELSAELTGEKNI